jgi:hypothetical protein
LPIVYGLFLFIQAFGFAFYKTNQSEKASLQYPNGKWVNIEAHSIAFSALLLWLIPAVYFSSIIGVSQMDEEIPRKLEHFQKQLKNLKMQSELRKNSSGDQSHSSLAKFPSSLSAIPVEIQFDEIDGQNSSTISGIRKCREQLSWLETRTMYSCQPALLWDIRRLDGRPLLSGRTRVVCHTVSWILVTSSFAIAIGISYGVPPHGNMCRPRWQLAALFAWVGSWVLDFPIMRWVPKGFDYWFLFVKDLIAGSFIVALILVVQGGILNKCSCYSSPKDKTMINPLDPLVAQRLDELFNHQWLGITVAGIAIQLVISAFMSWWYITAFRVYLQRNDGKSNFYPVWKEGRPYLVEWLERLRFLKQSRARSKQDIEVNSFQNYSREGTVSSAQEHRISLILTIQDHETIGLMQTLPVHPNREPEQSGQEAANINVGVTSAVEITEQDGIPKLGVKRAVKTY